MAPYSYLVETGVIVPDTSELLTEVQNEWRQAFGNDLAVTPNTPQGVIITMEALARDGVVRNNAAVANQINPDLAGGVFLDALMALYGNGRIPASPSLIVGVEVTGVAGVLIPAGSRARQGMTGPVFQTTGAVSIGAGGTGLATFQALEDGPIAVPAGALDTIVTGVLGWDTVTNPLAAIPGVARESDAAARTRRRLTLGLRGVALPEAIISGLYEVTGVRSVQFRENVTNAPLVLTGSITLVPHSIIAIVQGGTDDDVAEALLAKKSLGAAWNGTTTVNATDPASGQVYAVKFQRPEVITTYAAFEVEQGSFVGDATLAIRAAVVAYAEGLQEGEEGLQIGADVTAYELGGAVARVAPGLVIRSVTVGIAPTPTGSIVNIDIGQQAAITDGTITVTIV